MASFIIRRLIASIFVLFAATFLMYILTSFAGDPLDELRQSSAPNKAQLMEARSKLLNLDVPPPLRYAFHVDCIILGRSICTPRTPDCPACPISRFCFYYQKR